MVSETIDHKKDTVIKKLQSFRIQKEKTGYWIRLGLPFGLRGDSLYGLLRNLLDGDLEMRVSVSRRHHHSVAALAEYDPVTFVVVLVLILQGKVVKGQGKVAITSCSCTQRIYNSTMLQPHTEQHYWHYNTEHNQ